MCLLVGLLFMLLDADEQEWVGRWASVKVGGTLLVAHCGHLVGGADPWIGRRPIAWRATSFVPPERPLSRAARPHPGSWTSTRPLGPTSSACAAAMTSWRRNSRSGAASYWTSHDSLRYGHAATPGPPAAP